VVFVQMPVAPNNAVSLSPLVLIIVARSITFLLHRARVEVSSADQLAELRRRKPVASRASAMGLRANHSGMLQPSREKRALRDSDARHLHRQGARCVRRPSLNSSRPLHVRQGYTVTSQTSQSHESVKMFGFLPVSSTSQVNVVQMFVTLSRPTREARLIINFSEQRAYLVKQGEVTLVSRIASGRPGAFAIGKSNRNPSKKVLGTCKEPAEIRLCVVRPVGKEDSMRI
jgi:hypothetical protein